MNNVNKTLYIPLYGKAYVSGKGIILSDKKAEEIWQQEQFPIKGKSKSKWLAYYMGMRAAVYDGWVKEQRALFPNAVIVHIGCGMDSRALRVGTKGSLWYDVDFPDVIAERARYYPQTDTYRMLPSDVRNTAWLLPVPNGREAIIIMEGISMYLKPDEMQQLLAEMNRHFGSVRLLVDVYTSLAAKISKYKNPINDVGVTTVYGVDDPTQMEQDTGLAFVKEHSITPPSLINQLNRWEKAIFRPLFAGRISRKMYRLYEYQSRLS